MNADRLLALYDRVADAPDAISRLRRFVLDLAVRGKLVEQDPNERVSDRFAECGAFDWLPSTWRMLVFGDHCDIQGGNQPPKSQFVDEPRGGYVRLLQIRDLGEKPVPVYIPKESTSRFCRKGEILIGRYGASVGKVFWAEDGAYNVALAKFLWPEDAFTAKFAYVLLKSDLFQNNLSGASRSAQAGFNKGDLSNIPLPVPPLAEQRRIVAKVDELMALLDKLEAARSTREATRDRLTASSLARVTAPDTSPELFPAHARFAMGALPALSARPDQIKSLRQTILSLAVRGKLVEQDPEDEPASELLKRIAAEFSNAEKRDRGRKPLPSLDMADIPFELPDCWSWARFPELGTFGRGKSKHRPRNDPALYAGGTHLMIQTGDVARSRGRITTYTNKYNDTGLAQSMLWPKGTLCITIAANIADSGILDFDACFPDSVVGFVPAAVFDNARYFEYFVRTAKANLLEFAPATAQKNINLEILGSALIPLPPLAEQQRIVEKVDALMALCDRLEAALATADITRQRLLESLLHEALTEGAHNREVA